MNETSVRLDWFGIVDDIDACSRALIQATARADPDSGQRVEVRGHGCLLGTGVSEQHNIYIRITQCWYMKGE